MNALERYLATISLKDVESVFFHEFSIRQVTLEHWYKEGLSKDVHVDNFFKKMDWFWRKIYVDYDPISDYETVISKRPRNTSCLKTASWQLSDTSRNTTQDSTLDNG